MVRALSETRCLQAMLSRENLQERETHIGKSALKSR